jgi:hypothetical protein
MPDRAVDESFVASIHTAYSRCGPTPLPGTTLVAQADVLLEMIGGVELVMRM